MVEQKHTPYISYTVYINKYKNSDNLQYADDTTLMAESEEELKNLLIRVKGESAKNGLKLNIKKTKIMATGPITSRWEQVNYTKLSINTFSSLQY